MIRSLLILVLTPLFLLASCGDEGDIVTIPFVAGTVAGEDWQLQYGRASLDNRDRELTVDLYSRAEVSPNACQIVSTGNSSLRLVTPITVGNYSIPSLSANLFFEQPNSLQSFQATSGFIDVIEVIGNRVTGVIQANFDDDNEVEGRFIAEICN
ncbi:MAG: hypothetical protein AAGA85_22870 [Bacteroidota bacterium]